MNKQILIVSHGINERGSLERKGKKTWREG